MLHNLPGRPPKSSIPPSQDPSLFICHPPPGADCSPEGALGLLPGRAGQSRTYPSGPPLPVDPLGSFRGERSCGGSALDAEAEADGPPASAVVVVGATNTEAAGGWARSESGPETRALTLATTESRRSCDERVGGDRALASPDPASSGVRPEPEPEPAGLPSLAWESASARAACASCWASRSVTREVKSGPWLRSRSPWELLGVTRVSPSSRPRRPEPEPEPLPLLPQNRSDDSCY